MAVSELGNHSKKKQEKNPVYTPARVTVVILLALALVLGSARTARLIWLDIRQGSFNTLRSVSVESNKAITEMLQSRIAHLHSVWLQILDEESQEARLNVLARQQLRKDNYGFDWIGVVDETGKGLTSLGKTIDVSKGFVYSTCMQGDICISIQPVTYPDGTKREGVILAIPGYLDGTTPAGVIYQTFTTEVFSDILAVSSFDGNGYICLMGHDGRILAATDGAPFEAGGNIIVALQRRGENDAYANAMEKALGTNKSGGGYFELEDTGWYSYFSPVNLSIGEASGTFGALTFVPSGYISETVFQSFNKVIHMVFITIGFTVLMGIWVFRMQRWNQLQLEELAYRDKTTGQANYAAFHRDFARLRNMDGVFLCLDILEFKMINRYLGAAKGNEVLKRLGELYASLCDEHSCVARVTDDQFVFFFAGMPLEDAPEKCMELNRQTLQLLRSLGVTRTGPVFGYCAVQEEGEIVNFRSQAAFAKSIAKQRRMLYCNYDEKAAQLNEENSFLLSQFEGALEKKSIEIWYQPKYRTRYGCIGGAEALVRWRLDNGELIQPGRFIPLLEEQGKITMLDEYVFTQVCLRQKQRAEQRLPHVPISVNLSRNSLVDSDIVNKYLRILQQTGADQDSVYLEITEDSVQNNVQEVIQAFCQAGFHVLMDDFGRGNSNLANLRKDMFSGIKFDKSLIDLIGTEEENVLYYAILMVRSMGLSIVAEGVELAEQAEYLAHHECKEIQGFYYYRPMQEADFDVLLDKMACP